MEPLYQVLSVGSKKESFTEKFTVEKTTALKESEIQKILSLSIGVFLGDKSLDGNKIIYSGRVVYYVCYADESGALKKLETANEYSNEYSLEIDGICAYSVSVNGHKADYYFNNGVLVLKAYLEAVGSITACQSVSAFSGGENVVTEKKQIEYFKSFGQKTANYPLEENFELAYQVKDVIAQNVDAVVTGVQCGIGSIIADGETNLRCLLLQNAEKSDIIKEERTIPFRVEIECEEAMPQMISTASVSVRSLKTEVSVDEGTGKSAVSVSVALAFVGEAFAVEQAEILNDAFSTTEELEVGKSSCCLYSPEKIAVCDAKVSGRTEIEELAVGTRVTATCDENFEAVNISSEDGRLNVEGALSMKVYLKDGDGNISCINAETPVSFTCDCPIPILGEYSVAICAKNSYARLISLSEMEIGSNISASIKTATRSEISFICKVEPVGEKKPCSFPISVYIARQGEELWSLSKRLGVHPENLIRVNKDLQFPLTGSERIVIYRQK